MFSKNENQEFHTATYSSLAFFLSNLRHFFSTGKSSASDPDRSLEEKRSLSMSLSLSSAKLRTEKLTKLSLRHYLHKKS